MSTTYRVSGMSCEHCVAAVSEEVGRVPGVSQVDVALEQGTVTVSGSAYDDQAVRSAIDEAGYEVA
ncbi:MAG: copper ion binding protein [Propionibacteriales bacterium]|nr:copper ion binding protein [Propionibacteriales bacterium]